MLGTTGRLRDAETELRRALVLDPLAPVMHYNLGQILFWQRRDEEARGAMDRALAIDATFYPARTYLGYIAASEGRSAEALAQFGRVLDSRRSDDDLAVFAYGLARSGLRDSASAVLRQSVERTKLNVVSAADIALGYLGLGDTASTFHWLQIAHARHDSDLEAFVQSPLFDSVRQDPRWKALAAQMRLP